jgi:hypothetical protein
MTAGESLRLTKLHSLSSAGPLALQTSARSAVLLLDR